MYKIIRFVIRKKPIEKQIDEIQESVCREVESAIKDINMSIKFCEKALIRPEYLTTIYNNANLALFKLKNLVSDLKGDTRF